MTIKCPQCDTDNPDDSKFCKECATPLKPTKVVSITKTLQTPLASPGKTIAGKYKIQDELGRGGMGVVYKAKDIKLDRTVALKFLPPGASHEKEAKKRFIQEAKAASGLDHTNICTIYEIGDTEGEQMFIAMPYYEGESLKEKIGQKPLEIDEAVSISTQIAEGLSRAHKKGIVHRDIKPANIIITEEGVVKIVDFGIAKLGGEARLTQTGSTVGTTAYMSPEQTQGEKVDSRSDIWSLGVVLYEMLTGQLPFKGEQMQSMVYSILNKDLEVVTSVRQDVPRHIEQVIMRALEKDPEKRFQSVEELKQDLKTASSLTFPKTECSIVVLPFEDMSPNKDNEYFSDGLTEEIITDLSQIRSLCVISRNSAMTLKGTKKNTKTIGRELNVQHVLEGSVRKAGNNLRITAQLIDARTDVHLWAEKYKGTLDDVFDIQEKVSRSIVDALRLKLSPEESKKIADRPIKDIQAYECYLKARHEIFLFTEEALNRALQFLQNGLNIIGDNPLLHKGIGYVYYQFVNLGFKQEDYIIKTEECIKKLFSFDKNSPQGHFLLGLNYQAFWGDQKKSIFHFSQAYEANPNDPDLLFWYSGGLMWIGKTNEANNLIENLLNIDPLNPMSSFILSYLRYYEGCFKEALDLILRCIQIEPDNPVFVQFNGLYLACNNRLKEACYVLETFSHKMPDNIVVQLGLLLLHALRGDKNKMTDIVSAETQKTIERDLGFSSIIASIFSLGNEKNQALSWLENAVNRGFINYPFLNEYDPFLENIRSEPRFKKLMERVKYEWENFKV